MMQSERKAIIYTAPKHSVYVGRVERQYKRVHAVSTLLVSIDDDMRILDPLSKREFAGRSLLIPAGASTEIDTQGSRVALGFLDDMGTDLARLMPQMSDGLDLGKQTLYTGIRHERQIMQEAESLLDARPSSEDALACFDGWIEANDPGLKPRYDERVAHAASLIKEHYAENMSVAEVAEQVSLSVPRLIQLFKQVTGTPIRRYRLWHRIFATAKKLTEGYSLTDAAIASGFCDYAQFSRVYRELSGGSPAAARDNTEIRVYH